MTTLERPSLSKEVRDRLLRPAKKAGKDSRILSQATHNPSVKQGQYKSAPGSSTTNGNGNSNGERKAGSARRYYVAADDGQGWPPELSQYNNQFRETLDKIKRRHDSVVTTVGTGLHGLESLALWYGC